MVIKKQSRWDYLSQLIFEIPSLTLARVKPSLQQANILQLHLQQNKFPELLIYCKRKMQYRLMNGPLSKNPIKQSIWQPPNRSFQTLQLHSNFFLSPQTLSSILQIQIEKRNIAKISTDTLGSQPRHQNLR